MDAEHGHRVRLASKFNTNTSGRFMRILHAPRHVPIISLSLHISATVLDKILLKPSMRLQSLPSEQLAPFAWAFVRSDVAIYVRFITLD